MDEDALGVEDIALSNTLGDKARDLIAGVEANFEINEEGVIKKPKTILIALYEWIFDLSEIVFVILVSIFMYFC